MNRQEIFQKIYKLGPEKLKKKILVAGAGGIGCELLKSLAETGFEEIETVSFLFLLEFLSFDLIMLCSS